MAFLAHLMSRIGRREFRFDKKQKEAGLYWGPIRGKILTDLPMN